ncbi:MAG: pilus assembly protein PilM [Patescibacteria group bacterium]|nr:pilus assembly protein PilM [Patescibacteria group bacterium]
MGLFGPKKMSYVGVDLGVGGIKAVELRNEKGRARLVTYGFTERLPDAEPLNQIDSPKETADMLRAIFRKARCTTTKAVASLPVASVFSSVITVPNVAEKEFREAIQMQARKLIPVPLEEMVLDFKKIQASGEAAKEKAPEPEKEKKESGKTPDKQDKAEKDKKEQKDQPKTVPVLITGASKTMVQKYVTLFKAAGLELNSLETETFALIRALVGKDRAPTMIVDVGAARTNIIIAETGVPYVTRSLDMGGSTFTKAMSRALSIDMAAAEKMKCDIKSVSTIYPGEGLPRVFEATVAPLVTELQYSLSLYASRGEGAEAKRVEKIILTGGGASLPQLADHFAKNLNVKTYVGDPWARVVYPDGLRPVLDEIGYRFGVAVGLAMRDIE